MENPIKAIEQSRYVEQAKRLVDKYENEPDLQEIVDLDKYSDETERERHESKISRLPLESIRAVRHALATGADTIVLLDKSAREYGHIFLEIMPLVVLEYMKTMGKSEDEIKVPNVKFINLSEFLIGNMAVDNLDEIIEPEENESLKKIFDHKKVLIFDESTMHGHISHFADEMSPKEQYLFFDPAQKPEDAFTETPIQKERRKTSQFQYRPLSPRAYAIGDSLVTKKYAYNQHARIINGKDEKLNRNDYLLSRTPPTVDKIALFLSERFNTELYTEVGDSLGQGGNFGSVCTIVRPETTQIEAERMRYVKDGKSHVFSARNEDFSSIMFNEVKRKVQNSTIKTIIEQLVPSLELK